MNSPSPRAWIDRHGREGEQYQFDVVGILVDESRVQVKHVTNAFQVQT